MRKSVIALAVTGCLFATSADAVTIDFDGLASGTTVNTQFSGVTFSMAGGGAPLALSASPFVNSSPIGLLNSSTSNSFGVDDLVITFDSSANDVGFFYGAVDDAFSVTVEHIGGTSVVSVADPGLSSALFLDLSAFSSVTSLVLGFGSISGNPDLYLIDDLSFELNPISQVPLPAAFPLLAGGLGLMGLIGWRRKRKAAAA